MKKYVIVTDSCSDLSKEMREKYNVEYIPMHFSYDGNDMPADLDWKGISVKDFYDLMRNGKRVITSQINATTYRQVFEQYVKDGYDVLSISCSSALSASVKASCIARDELCKEYPDAKIVCVDSLNACAGLGMLCIRASELRAEGKTIEEVAAWVEENKKYVNQEATVEKLSYLKQAGRVSAASAFFGGLLNVKPIIISDAIGQNVAVEKVKGRGVALHRVVERIAEEYDPTMYPFITILHADCGEDALKIKEDLIATMGIAEEYIRMGYIGPVIGATVGPGTIGVYCLGKEVTYSAADKE